MGKKSDKEVDGRGVITLPNGQLVSRRKSHRSWMMENLTAEQIMRVHPCAMCVTKLVTEKGYPEEFFWPVIGDYAGCALLINAVMDRDIIAIHKLNARYPEFDFDLGEWYVALKAEYVRSTAIQRETLRSEPIGIGRTLRIEMELDKDTGIRTLRHSVYRGSKRVASKIVKRHNPTSEKVQSHG